MSEEARDRCLIILKNLYFDWKSNPELTLLEKAAESEIGYLPF